MLLLTVLQLFLVFQNKVAAANSDPSSVGPTSDFILARINKVLSEMGANFWDPSPHDQNNQKLFTNNLKSTTLADQMHYVYFAFAAYCYETLKDWTCTHCKDLGPSIRYHSEINNELYQTKAFFAVDDRSQEIILSFKGSNDGFNLIQDLVMVQPTFDDTTNIRIHPRFYDATLSIYPEVMQTLRALTYLNPSHKVVLTGHSIGGAQACLTVFLIKYKNVFPNTTIQLYTYGAPRVGNQAFATYFNSLDILVARVVNRADFVPHVFAPASLGFVHHQNEVWIVNSAGDRRESSSLVYEDLTCSDSQGPFFGIFDHFRYYNVSSITCFRDEPATFALRTLLNLKSYFPAPVLLELMLATTLNRPEKQDDNPFHSPKSGFDWNPNSKVH